MNECSICFEIKKIDKDIKCKCCEFKELICNDCSRSIYDIGGHCPFCRSKLKYGSTKYRKCWGCWKLCDGPYFQTIWIGSVEGPNICHGCVEFERLRTKVLDRFTN